MTEANVNALIVALPATLAALGALVVSMRTLARADVAAGKQEVAAVKSDQRDKKLESVAKTAEAIHQLTNSAMSAALKTSAMALRRVADMSGMAGDLEAATVAESAFHDHQAKQALVDAAVNNPAVLVPENQAKA